MGYKNVLVPLDGSAIATSAIEHAVKLVEPVVGRVVLLCVVETPPMQMEGYGEVLGTMDIEQKLRESYEAMLKEESAKLAHKGIMVETLIRDGLAHEEIAGVCAEMDIDVVVMTTHGRTGIAHWIMGSVAERVVRIAPCSVMIVRGKPSEGGGK